MISENETPQEKPEDPRAGEPAGIEDWTRVLLLLVMAYDRQIDLGVVAQRVRCNSPQEVVASLISADVETVTENLKALPQHMENRAHRESVERLIKILATDAGKSWAAGLLATIATQEQDPTFEYVFTNEGKRPKDDPLVRTVTVSARNYQEARAFCLTRHGFDLGKEGGTCRSFPEGSPEQQAELERGQRTQKLIARFHELSKTLSEEDPAVLNLIATKLYDDLSEQGSILGARVERLPSIGPEGPQELESITCRPFQNVPAYAPRHSGISAPRAVRSGSVSPAQIKDALGAIGVPQDVLDRNDMQQALEFGSRAWPFVGPALVSAGEAHSAGYRFPGPMPRPEDQHSIPIENLQELPPQFHDWSPYQPSYHESFMLGNAPGQTEASAALIQQQEQIHEMRAAQRSRQLEAQRKKGVFRDALSGLLHVMIDKLSPRQGQQEALPFRVGRPPLQTVPADPFANEFVPFDPTTMVSSDIALSRAHAQSAEQQGAMGVTGGWEGRITPQGGEKF